MDEIERDIRNTIRHWQQQGVTTEQAWRALEGSAGGNHSWAMVEARMIRWATASFEMKWAA